MSRILARRERVRQARDAGFTLVEMLVAMLIAGLVGSILLSMLLASQHSVSATTGVVDLTAESRTALNRIADDLRSATPLTQVDTSTTPATTTVVPAITAVANPTGPGYDANAVTSVTFNLDADGDGCVAGIASENISPAQSASPCSSLTTPNLAAPETETVCYDPARQLVVLIPVDPTATDESVPVGSCAGGQPLLAGKVTSFTLSFRSSLYRYQNTTTGITSWNDLDAAGPPVGNADNRLDAAELPFVNAVGIDMTLTEDGRTQHFTTEADLRNVNPT